MERSIVRIGSLAIVAFAALGLMGIWVADTVANGADADPGGRILHQLQTASQGLPSDAQISYRHDQEPKWDSCDGRPGTFGWDPVLLQIHFRSKTATTVLVAHADQELRRLGWVSDYQNQVNGGVQIGWSRQLDNGSLAKAQLTSVIFPQNGAPPEWDLFVTAPPSGPQASGC